MKSPFRVEVDAIDPLTYALMFRFADREFKLIEGRDEKVLNRFAAELNADISNVLADYLRMKGIDNKQAHS